MSVPPQAPQAVDGDSRSQLAPPDPLVSAVIPCHDEFPQLDRTLAALAAQDADLTMLEVICVDNNSEDPHISDVVRTYWEQLNITVVQQPLLAHSYALCRARNLGMRIARGTWIWTLDSDCCPDPGALAALLQQIEQGPQAQIFTGERCFIDASALTPATILADRETLRSAPGVMSASNYHLERDRRFPEITQLPDLEQPWDMMHGGNTVFRRSDALAVGGYDERFDGTWGYEDDEFAHRLITHTQASPRFVADMVVYHQEPGPQRVVADRPDKAKNPNWHRVCALIPGYRDYKLAKFARSGVQVHA